MNKDYGDDMIQPDKFGRRFGGFVVALQLFISLLVITGCNGSLPGYDTARCLLEPATASYSAEGVELGYNCAGQKHTFEIGRYDLPEAYGGITCEFVLHDFEIPVVDPPPFIWTREGSDPRCLEYIEALGAGLTEEPLQATPAHEEPPESSKPLEGQPGGPSLEPDEED